MSTRPADNALPTEEPGHGLSRRRFLRTTGAGAAAVGAGGAVLARSAAAAAAAAGTGAYEHSNGYFSVRGTWGKLTSVAVDPTGRGQYEHPDTFGPVFLGYTDVFTGDLNAGVRWSRRGDLLRLTGLTVSGPVYSVGQAGNNRAAPKLTAGHSLTQSFTVSAGNQIDTITMLMATYGAASAGVTATLRTGTITEPGAVVISKQVTFADNSTVTLAVPAQPAGQYVLTLTDPVGTPSWWYHDGGATAVGGAMAIDSSVVADANFVFTASGHAPGPAAAVDIVLHGPRLQLSYTLTGTGTPASDLGLTFSTPWQRDGYSVAYDDGVLFDRFYTDNGQLMPAQQLKRRPSWGTNGLGPARSIVANGTGDYDIVWRGAGMAINGVSPIDPTCMSLQFTPAPGSPARTVHRRVTVEVRPADRTLPATFPIFEASDEAAAAALTTFFHERALSAPQAAGATNGADWKDWTGRMYDWTPGGFSSGEREAISAIKQDPDGYVWTWNPSDSRGWPFPDPTVWDTRHFVSNPMYVLGAWRYYSWTGDRAFLATMLPRVRKAIDYCLTTLQGSDGLLTEPGPDHDGLPGGIGSNYWDITPFGHLDAYTNAYFYGCLEPAAQLEDHGGDPARARMLRALAPAVRARFNAVFWDETAGRFIECVDVDGTRHDYGSAFVNLEAMSFDLASAEQVDRIYAWLEHGATELTDTVLLLNVDAGSTNIEPAHPLGQSVVATAPFAQVGVSVAASDAANAGLDLTLRSGGPTGAVIASQHISWRWPGGWAPLSFATQPAGDYFVEVTASGTGLAWANGPAYTAGKPYLDGVAVTDVPSRTIALVSAYRDGPADIYDRFGWAPRATSRKNNFWYFWGWAGVTVPWEGQLQDGGTDLYLSGFDVLCRARYRGGDDAWARLSAVLDRWKEPDHLCGGDPLSRGETPQNEITPGSVGVDIPFPESGLAPGTFLEAIAGVEAHPDALLITPRLPAALDHIGVRNMSWRGRIVDLRITRDRVSLRGGDVAVSVAYRSGETVRIPAPPALRSSSSR